MFIENIEEVQNSGPVSLSRDSLYGRILPKRYSVQTVYPIKTVINTTDEVRQCRICLDGMETQDNLLLTPCKCIGSVRFVHDKCYRKWIERQYSLKDQRQRQELIQNGVQCQICKDRVVLLFRNKYILCEKNKFRSKFMSNPAAFIFFIIFLLINIGCIGYTAYSAITNPIAFKGNDLVTSIVIVSAISVLSITAVVTFFYFLAEYCIEKVWILDSFSLKNTNNLNKQADTRFQIHAEELC